MRAWWSELLVPQNAANLRLRYGPSLVNFAEPSQYTDSAPDLPRISISLSPISLIAVSHAMRVHWPFANFIGYRRLGAPCTSPRVAAPLAQCEPRLIGLSQPGS